MEHLGVSNGARKLALERGLDLDQIKSCVLADDPTVRMVMREHVVAFGDTRAKDDQTKKRERETGGVMQQILDKFETAEDSFKLTKGRKKERVDPSDRVRGGQTRRLQTGQGEHAQQTLCEAASAGKADTLEKLLGRVKNPYNPHSRYQGYTALGAACKGGHLDAARVLLDRGAKATTGCEYGTPLDLAIKRAIPHYTSTESTHGVEYERCEDLVKLLLEHDASVHNRSGCFFGMTPFMWAVENGCVRLTRLLIKAGAKADLRDKQRITSRVERETARGYPAPAGHAECMRLLTVLSRWNKVNRLARTVGIAAQCFRLWYVDINERRYKPGARGAVLTRKHFESTITALEQGAPAGAIQGEAASSSSFSTLPL